MTEPHLPVSDPEPNSYWDDNPARCSEAGCRNLLQNLHPASRLDGRLEGSCPEHGLVVAHFSASQNFEIEP